MDRKQQAQDAQDKFNDEQKKIVRQWKNFANTHGREAYEDLMQYIESQREMYRQYAEERQMPHPNGGGERVALDNDTVAVLLQSSRGLNIVKTYIKSRVDADVSTTDKN